MVEKDSENKDGAQCEEIVGRFHLGEDAEAWCEVFNDAAGKELVALAVRNTPYSVYACVSEVDFWDDSVVAIDPSAHPAILAKAIIARKCA